MIGKYENFPPVDQKRLNFNFDADKFNKIECKPGICFINLQMGYAKVWINAKGSSEKKNLGNTDVSYKIDLCVMYKIAYLVFAKMTTIARLLF